MTSWLLVRFLTLAGMFPPEHPWSVRRFGLREWKSGRTALCRQLDWQFAIMFWLGVASVLLVVATR